MSACFATIVRMTGVDAGGRRCRRAPARTALADDLSFLLARANALSLAAGNAALAEHGLRVRSYSVLALAAERQRGPPSASWPSSCGSTRARSSRSSTTCRRAGWCGAKPDPADRRANVVEVTPAGRELFVAAQRSARDAESALHSLIPAAERNRLGELLRLLAFPA